MKPLCDYCGMQAQLVTGSAIYPHRDDLAALKFWACRPCDAFVGCHAPGSYHLEGTRKVMHTGVEPLGRLANAELRLEKRYAHAAFDPIWKARAMSRREAYAWLAAQLGIPVDQCHIGMFDVDRCRAVVAAVEGWRLAA